MRLAEDYAPLDIDLASPAPVDRVKAVMTCMVDAFETLRRIPGAVGPKQPGSGWPAIVREMGEEYSFRSADREFQRALSKAQISRMEEVLAWPAQFLADEPLAADALNLWAMCKAWGRSIDGVLQARAKQAADIARVVEREINERRGVQRKAAAGEVAEWANMKLATADGERVERIRANALIRLERELTSKGLVHAAVIVKPAECSPDKVISRTSLDRWRFVGARVIADSLN
ncbi:hypothetical protein ACETRX_03950 [Labrys portucalensis]|uniref:DUF222 domain-containing protein n=1 Tax=Labrys neptuniae TaxID=376174 RepID=A0ABV6Z9A7_9HYPH